MFVLPAGVDPVTVDVTAPSFSSNVLSHHVTVNSDASMKLEIDISLQLVGNEQSSKGIHVQASGDIVLLIINRQKFTSDGYLALPVHALGKEYYAVSEYPDDNCQFAIVATQDGTVVDITLSNNKNAKSVQFAETVHIPGETFQVTLDKFGTVQIQSDGDLTGSYISSNKPIAFLSGNRRTIVDSGFSSDHLVEQLFSVDKWGKKYNVVPVPERTVGDFFKVVASVDSTSIDVACLKDTDSYNTVVSLVKAGDFEMLHIKPGRYCSFKSNNAIMVIQFVLSQSNNKDKHDPSMILITPEEQYLSNYMFTTPRITGGSYENFLMIVVKTNQKSGLRLDGNELPVNTNFQDIPGTDLAGCYITVNDGYHNIGHVSPIAVFSGILYGRAKYESYGISIGLRLGPVNLVSMTP
ncbi:IgGFc-binding protein-like [Mizuhopecten yessoensis]|uniref:IgGFc-binding protein-like n=1 Tax=Mizuhopecten yessoensis TaxID=6573 RepID=UPI000B45C76A|nr:IgGFc-binding protein-like [Mizuhopecten yessoensis]